ncbi:hypothetical protein DFA_08015 [Cavenderia fasciculata]|uniref:Uncharacterized protein n=1 Tax=Cavenderia fasciculata TaxID=261658 RepID=F4Q4M5_CACFS|nr:uncharacterized protein DFA_08015 [Cavenderia fasciculata]EGG17034.1 hypothetical protein DFA_08015 [Cavenderia fasciculata]|eukprot:XP_004355518.1 hypothetical protein DFA_08015 [Cavenderia fasciculata]
MCNRVVTCLFVCYASVDSRCGKHVEEVLASVPFSERCNCNSGGKIPEITAAATGSK